jgi:WD40 repeat protein
LAFSQDGEFLAVEEPGAVSVWHIIGDKLVGRLPVDTPGFDATTGSAYPRFVAQFDPSGTVLAVLDATTRPAKLSRWEWKSTKPAQELNGNFGRDGVQALVGWSAGAIHYIVRGHLESWDGDSPPRVLAALPTQTGDIGQAGYLSLTKILLTYGEQTHLWDLGSKTVTAVLPDHQSSQFALTGDQAMLAVSGDDGYVNMWDLRQGDPPVGIGRYSVAPHIALDDEGYRLAIADTSGLMLVRASFAGPFATVLDLARSRVARHLTHDEEARYVPAS